MYQRNHHQDMYRLSAQQHNSLAKHQQMIDGALRWQRHQLQETAEEQSKPRWQLRLVFAGLISSLTK